MIFRTLLFLLAGFTSSFVFAGVPKIANGDPFVALVQQAGSQLKDLCALYSDHPYCDGNGAQPIGNKFEEAQDEQILKGTIERISKNVFQFDETLSTDSPGLFPIPTPAERAGYFAKMSYLDQMSNTQNILQHNLIALIVLQMTDEWINIYGDPFRDVNLNVDESNHILPMREDAAYAQERRNAAINLAGIAAVSVYAFKFGAKAPFVKNLLSGVVYLTAGLRSRLPINLFSQLAQASLPVIAAAKPSLVLGRDANRKYLNLNDVLPSPAHLITFGFNADLNMVGDDVREQWLSRERDLYDGAVKSGVKWGALIFLTYIGNDTGTKLATYLTAKGLGPAAKVAKTALSPMTFENLKYLRWAKFLEVTPVGIVASVTIGKVIDETLFMFRLSNAARSLHDAAEANDKNGVYFDLARIIRLYVKSTDFVEQTVATEKAFTDYATMDRADAKFDELTDKRTNFMAQMNPINFPASSGAAILKQSLCNPSSIAPRSKADWSDDQTRTSLLYINAMIASLKAFKSSAGDLASWFNVEIPYLRRKNLNDSAQMLQNYAAKFAALNKQVQTLLDKYPTPYPEEHGGDPMDMLPPADIEWHNLDLARTALRNIEDIEYRHKNEFKTFKSDYFCGVQNSN